MSYEWTDLAFQQIDAGDAALFVFPLCVIFVFLVLAAQYESVLAAPGHHPDRADGHCWPASWASVLQRR